MTQVSVNSLEGVFAPENPPASLRYFRDVVGPSATAISGLAGRLNSLLCKQGRILFSHATNTGLHATFDSGTASSITSYRCAFTTGPATRRIRVRVIRLPSPTAVPGITNSTITLTEGLTSTGGSTQVFQNFFNFNDDTKFDLLTDSEATFNVGVESSYRLDIQLLNELRLVSVTVYEDHQLLSFFADTNTTPAVVDTNGMVKGKPITSDQVFALINAADKLYKNGKTLGEWTADYPGDERTRSSGTAANIIDASTTATTTTPGWVISIQHSATLDTTSVPVTFWCYAGTAGTGSVQFFDSSNSQVKSLSIGSAGWYAGTGTLSTSTSKIDVYIAGDGSNNLTLYACGIIQRNAADLVAVPALSWMPVMPRYVGYSTEVITRNEAG